MLGGGVASSASRCRIRSIAAVIAASSDWYEKVTAFSSRVVEGSVGVACRASTPSSRLSTTASGGSRRNSLVGISCRIDRLHKLCRWSSYASNFEGGDSDEQRKGPEKVSKGSEHQEVVRSTVEVAMVIMASIGTPTGDARSRSTGKLIFFSKVG